MDNKIIDLDVFEEETLDVKANGSVIKIMKPTEQIFIKMLAYQELEKKENVSPQETLDLLVDILYIIMNNNANGVMFTKENVISIPFSKKIKLMEEYAKFITQITTNPN